MFRNTVERVRRRRQGIGNPTLIAYGLVWLLRKLSRSGVEIHYRYVLVQPVRSQPLLRGRTGGVRVRVLRGEELVRAFEEDRDGAFSRPPRDRSRLYRRVERGDVCVVASRSERIEGILWLTFGTFDESDFRAEFVVRPEDAVAWDSEMYIVDGARGGLMFAALWDGAYEELRSRDYRWIVTQTSAFNGPSLQSQYRLGCQRIGRMIYACLGPVQITLSSLPPHFHMNGPRGRGPVCRIPAPESDRETGAGEAVSAPARTRAGE